MRFIDLLMILLTMYCIMGSVDARGDEGTDLTAGKRKKGEQGGRAATKRTKYDPRATKDDEEDEDDEEEDDDDDDDDEEQEQEQKPSAQMLAKIASVEKVLKKETHNRDGLVKLAIEVGVLKKKEKPPVMAVLLRKCAVHRIQNPPPFTPKDKLTASEKSDTNKSLVAQVAGAAKQKLLPAVPLKACYTDLDPRSEQGLAIMTKANAMKNGYKLSTHASKFDGEQELPVCTHCKWAWSRDVKVYDITAVHWKSQNHREKVKNAAGNTPSTSEPVASSADITELAVELTAMLGIPFRAASLLLKGLAGRTIPAHGIDIQRGWREHGNVIYGAHVDEIKKNLGNQKISLVHDGGSSLQGHTVAVFIAQTRERSYCLPLQYSDTPYTGETLKKALEACLGEVGMTLSDVRLIRSDRGGASGGVSRELSVLLNVPYISCTSHLLHNVCSDVRTTLKADSDLVYEILHLSNFVFHDAKQQKRWRAFQKQFQKGSAVAELETLYKKMTARKKSASKLEMSQMLPHLIAMAKEKVTEEDCESVSKVTTFEELHSVFGTILSHDENSREAVAEAVRAPRVFDTRFISFLDAAQHLEQRVRPLFLFLSQEVQKKTASKSIVKLAQILRERGFEEVQEALSEFVEATTPMREVLQRYANAQAPGCGAVRVWSDLENLLEDLKKLSERPGRVGSICKIMWEGLNKRWRDKLEPGYFYYLALRQLTPAGFETGNITKSLMSNADLRMAFGWTEEDVSDEAFSLFSLQAGDFMGDSDIDFWENIMKKEEGCSFLAEGVLDALSTAPSCTSPDSAMSVVRHMLPAGRGAVSLQTHGFLSLLGINQDVARM